MDWGQLTPTVGIVLLVVLMAEASNGWTDAPTGTSAAVASGALTSRQALWMTAICNFLGVIAAFLLGAAVAKTIGTGIVKPQVITVASIGVAMMTTVFWAAAAAWLGLPVSKTHSLLAALAGVGCALGGLSALLPASGDIFDSGWVAVVKGVVIAVFCGSAVAWFLTSVVIRLQLHERIPTHWWRNFQRVTVCAVGSGHGFNDGLKYVGVFTLVLLKGGVISTFVVLPEVIVLCAFVMGAGTLIGGWRIHKRLDAMVNDGKHHGHPGLGKKKFEPHMGVCTELTSAAAIWQTGWLGIPMSTNHSVVSAMAGARSASGKVHIGSVVRILWGWVVTYAFCFGVAYYLTLTVL